MPWSTDDRGTSRSATPITSDQRDPPTTLVGMPRTSVDVAVIGGGPAGLMAARRIAASGRSVAVLERANAVGGMAGSFDIAGVRVDFGSHRLHPVVAPRLLDDLR